MHFPKSLTRGLLGLAILVLVLVYAAGLLQERDPFAQGAMLQQEGLSLEGGTDWINSGPITLKELRGKVVVLDFWTYCCINCHHVLPVLAQLEEKYKNEVVVIGVHTPKFFAERDTENIRQKVHEYQIKHPVINDADQVLWNRFGVSSWPTVVVIDPQGNVKAEAPGEPSPALLDKFIGRLVETHRLKGDLNTEPLKFQAESDKPDPSALSYPGKVLVDEPGKRLFVADTAHNRLVQADLNGGHAVVVGNGVPGLIDGDYAKAQFNRPQGMCLVGGTLYVADTENHALRAVDLKAKSVKTVAGNGQQTHRLKASGPGLTTPLSSPWDVIQLPKTQTLAIAMAGIHEIWHYEIESGIVSTWAGTGREDVGDGPVRSAAFAQPSGLATDGDHLFVADSEGSSVRAINLRTGRVQTIVGTHDLANGQSLFAFDDIDAVGGEARLQHCLGVAYAAGKLYIADTYNNKIKVCTLPTMAVETLVGRRQSGKTDNPAHFYQPAGLSVAPQSQQLYVADTDNSAIRVVDLKNATVRTLEFDGLKPPSPPRKPPSFARAAVTKLPDAEIAPGKTLSLEVTLPLAPEFKLNEQVPMLYVLESPEKPDLLADNDRLGVKVDPPAKEFSVGVKFAKALAPGDKISLKLGVKSFVCSEKSNLCTIKDFVWSMPLTVSPKGSASIKVPATEQ